MLTCQPDQGTFQNEGFPSNYQTQHPTDCETTKASGKGPRVLRKVRRAWSTAAAKDGVYVLGQAHGRLEGRYGHGRSSMRAGMVMEATWFSILSANEDLCRFQSFCALPSTTPLRIPISHRGFDDTLHFFFKASPSQTRTRPKTSSIRMSSLVSSC